MSGEGVHQTSGFDVPFFDGAVHAAGVEGVVVGGKGDRSNCAVMAFEGADKFSSFGIPELDGLVVAGAGNVLTVGTDGHV